MKNNGIMITTAIIPSKVPMIYDFVKNRNMTGAKRIMRESRLNVPMSMEIENIFQKFFLPACEPILKLAGRFSDVSLSEWMSAPLPKASMAKRMKVMAAKTARLIRMNAEEVREYASNKLWYFIGS